LKIHRCKNISVAPPTTAYNFTHRELRISEKITQEHLATLCEVDVRTIQRIEKGKQNISINLLFSIADGLNIKADILLAKIFSQN